MASQDIGLSHWADILVVALYFICVLAVGLWAVFSSNRSSVKGYFLAGRSMWWLPVGASLFASNIGSEHFIGLAGTGAASGIAIVLYEWLSMPLVLLLGWLFLPVYISAGVYTLPEYLEKRFGGKTLRLYLSCLSMVLYIFTKIAVCMYAGALFIQTALGWNMYVSIVVLLLVTAVYTVVGGLAAVIYTDTIQTIIMTIGAVALTFQGFKEIGGYHKLFEDYPKAHQITDNSTSCGLPREDAFNLFRHPLYSDNPWPGIILQASVGCLWYWCADQVIVQRTLAAKNLSHAKAGCLVAGYLKLLPLFLIVFPGMISRTLYKETVGCSNSTECEEFCGNPAGCSNSAYPTLIIKLMPLGVRGLLMAAMMSAIVSSLTSIFNSASTLFTMDIWTRVRPTAKQWELLTVGRICVMVLCVISILWVPMVQSSAGGQLFVYIQAIQGYLGSPVGAIFALAIFWPRATEKGAVVGLLTGHVCGIIRMTLDFVYPVPPCGEVDTRPGIVKNIHYTYFGQMVILVTLVTAVVVSLCTKPRTKEQLQYLTWWSKAKGCPPKSRDDAETNDHPESVELKSNPSLKDNRVGVDSDDATVAETETISGCDIQNDSCLSRWWRYMFGVGQSVPTRESLQDREVLLWQPSWLKIFLNANAVFALIIMSALFIIYR